MQLIILCKVILKTHVSVISVCYNTLIACSFNVLIKFSVRSTWCTFLVPSNQGMYQIVYLTITF